MNGAKYIGMDVHQATISLRFIGAVITSWLASVALGRGLGLFHYFS